MSEFKKQNILINLLLFFVILIIGLFGAEFLMHKLQPKHEEYLLDPKLKVIGNPAAGRDKNGYRNETVPLSADIVAIGDSQTDGLLNAKNIADSWPHALGKMLEKNVYQVALAGYGPVQYNYLLDQALTFNPNTIIIGFYLGNDLFDVFDMVYQNDNWPELKDKNFTFNEPINIDITKENFISLKYAYKKGSWQYKLMTLRQWLRQNSYLYGFLSDTTAGLRNKLGLLDDQENREQRLNNFADNNQDLLFFYNENPKTTLSPFYRATVINLNDQRIQEAFRITQQLFLEMHKKLTTQNKQFIILIIPTKEMVYGQFMAEKKIIFPEQLQTYLDKEKEVIINIEKFCQTNHLKCVNATNKLVFGVAEKKEIYPADIDGHPTAIGYQLIAESVFEYLQNNLSTNSLDMIKQ
ncbi:MAG TPA: hypothetical protein PLF15_00845 [bacterium]|nr:hypothetical protein [bacterium]